VITWELAAGEAHVRQDRAEVFYRVEHAADVFEVATSHAVVRVRGTCFRIVLDAYGTTVTVDEGTVEIANDAPPRMLSGASLAAPSVGAATQAALLARDRALRERIVTLEAQVAGVARATEAINQRSLRWFDLNPDELATLAKRCLVPLDIEPIAGSTIMDTVLEKGAQTVGLTEEERVVVTRLIERTQPAYLDGLQQIVFGADHSYFTIFQHGRQVDVKRKR